jgi:hypothetical protein
VTDGYIAWRDKAADVAARFSVSTHEIVPSDPSMTAGSLCESGPDYEGWFPDFGSDDRRFIATLFFYRDEFYLYFVNFHSDPDFGFMLSTLTNALGEPTKITNEPVKNRMGAEFDNVVAVWIRGEVELELTKRAKTIDKGTLKVTYLPISKTVEIHDGGTAPF